MIEFDVASWTRQINAHKEVVLRVSKDTINEVATKLFSRIVDYTPVGNPSIWKSPYVPKGYKPGTLKKSWQINFAPSEVVIRNDQPYAQRIEYGWSTQAPYGMMRRGIIDFPTLLEQVANKNKK